MSTVPITDARARLASIVGEALTTVVGRQSTVAQRIEVTSQERNTAIAEGGWVQPHLPKPWGRDAQPIEQIIIAQEFSTGRVARPQMGIAAWIIPSIVAYGTDEQQQQFLPPTFRGEMIWCQLFSEPGAGSDLAALTMAARDDGEDLVCTGSKIWTTHAREANWMFALVRTTRSDKKQRGITFILIDMSTPGIEIRPLVMTSGEEVQSQVFFDAVRIPKANILGNIDEGWTVAKYLLEFERGGGAAAPALQVMAEDVARVAATQPGPDGGALIDDPAFARKLADARIRTEVLEILEHRVLAALTGGGNPGAASSMLKVISTELSQTLTELALEAAGPRGRAYQPHATCPGGPIADFEPPADGYVSGEPWQAVAPLRYFNDRAGSIYAGSNEIQRNILAKAELGL